MSFSQMTTKSAPVKILKLRSIDDKIITVTDNNIIRESDLMKFAIFQTNKTVQEIDVPLTALDAEAVILVIKLAECFRDEPPYLGHTHIDDFKGMNPNHPAVQYIKQLSTKEFITVSMAARNLRAQRLLDFLSCCEHDACTTQLKNTVLRENYFSEIEQA